MHIDHQLNQKSFLPVIKNCFMHRYDCSIRIMNALLEYFMDCATVIASKYQPLTLERLHYWLSFIQLTNLPDTYYVLNKAYKCFAISIQKT